jgi:hypothetical protein
MPPALLEEPVERLHLVACSIEASRGVGRDRVMRQGALGKRDAQKLFGKNLLGPLRQTGQELVPSPVGLEAQPLELAAQGGEPFAEPGSKILRQKEGRPFAVRHGPGLSEWLLHRVKRGKSRST